MYQISQCAFHWLPTVLMSTMLRIITHLVRKYAFSHGFVRSISELKMYFNEEKEEEKPNEWQNERMRTDCISKLPHTNTKLEWMNGVKHMHIAYDGILPATSLSHSSRVSSAVAHAISVAFSRFNASSLMIPTASK